MLNNHRISDFTIETSQKKIYYFCALKKGPVAEWSGRALQKLPQRFESARDHKRRKKGYFGVLLYLTQLYSFLLLVADF
jgi:hypothetical protein